MNLKYLLREPIAPPDLHRLLRESWDHAPAGYPLVLSHSLTWVTARDGERLVGFVNLAWDGGSHAFLLDPTVHPSLRRRGIGTELVRHAVEAARASGVAWIHVDYEPQLEPFYARCGFGPTRAGLIRLRVEPEP